MKRETIKLVLTLLIVGTIETMAIADDRKPSEQEIVDRLTPTNRSLTRSLSRESGQSRSLVVEAVASPKIDLEVNFEYDSARLTADATKVIDELGRALRHPSLAGSIILIAGHTDGRGSDEYNLKLSERRAKAVAEYLNRQHRIDMSALRIEGHGKRRLLYPDNPDNALNRRVEVANLGPEGRVAQ